MDKETKLEVHESTRVAGLRNIDTRVLYDLKEDRIAIGRQPDNQIMLVDDVYISGHHAVIYFNGDECLLEDLGSRNGTLKNGEGLVDPVSIQKGDVITIGRTKFEVL